MKSLKLLTAIILFSITLHAQTYIGIDVAGNSSHWALSLNGSQLSYSDQLGISAGVPVAFTVSKLFDLSTGLRFASKGTTTIIFDFDDFKIEPFLRVYYIEVPILLKGKFGSGKIHFNPIAGLSVGYGVAGRIDKDVSDENGVRFSNQALNFKEERLNRLNIQLHIGAGATYFFSNGNLLQFDLQYLHGVSNLSASNDFDSDDSFSVTARGFELSIGYLFRLGKKEAGEAPVHK